MTGRLQNETVPVVGRGDGIARADPDRDAVRLSFDTKAIGPLALEPAQTLHIDGGEPLT